MKRLIVLLLYVVMVLMPVMALAANGDLGDYIGPEAGVCWSLLVVSLAIGLDTVLGILVGISRESLI